MAKLEVVNMSSSETTQKRKKVYMDTLIVGFSLLDFKGILAPHNDPLVIIIRVHGFEVQRILVDGESLVDVML